MPSGRGSGTGSRAGLGSESLRARASGSGSRWRGGGPWGYLPRRASRMGSSPRSRQRGALRPRAPSAFRSDLWLASDDSRDASSVRERGLGRTLSLRRRETLRPSPRYGRGGRPPGAGWASPSRVVGCYSTRVTTNIVRHAAAAGSLSPVIQLDQTQPLAARWSKMPVTSTAVPDRQRVGRRPGRVEDRGQSPRPPAASDSSAARVASCGSLEVDGGRRFAPAGRRLAVEHRRVVARVGQSPCRAGWRVRALTVIGTPRKHASRTPDRQTARGRPPASGWPGRWGLPTGPDPGLAGAARRRDPAGWRRTPGRAA